MCYKNIVLAGLLSFALMGCSVDVADALEDSVTGLFDAESVSVADFSEHSYQISYRSSERKGTIILCTPDADNGLIWTDLTDPFTRVGSWSSNGASFFMTVVDSIDENKTYYKEIATSGFNKDQTYDVIDRNGSEATMQLQIENIQRYICEDFGLE